MKEKIENYNRKYEAQDNIVEAGVLEFLDERTLHETIKAMLINTTKDSIRCELAFDPEMTYISQIMFKENKTKEEIKRVKQAQNRLRNAIHLSEIAENSLSTLLYQMFMSPEIKKVFKQEIPDLYENLYNLIDLEDDIIDSIVTELSESEEILSYKQICSIINGCISDFVDNIEEYNEEIIEHESYSNFVLYREEWRKNRNVSKL